MLAKRDSKFWIIAIACCLMAVAVMGGIPSLGVLSKDAISVLLIFIASLVMWVFVSVDWSCLLTVLALGSLPFIGFNKTLAGVFGNSTVAFLLFTFTMIYPLTQTNFIKRWVVRFITNPIARGGSHRFVFMLFMSVTFLGCFISPSVLFIAFLPFLDGIIDELQLRDNRDARNLLMLGSAICINLSSGMTAIGHVWPLGFQLV